MTQRDKEVQKQRKMLSVINRNSSTRHEIVRPSTFSLPNSPRSQIIPQKVAEVNNEIAFAEMTTLNEKIAQNKRKFDEEKIKTMRVGPSWRWLRQTRLEISIWTRLRKW